MQNPLLHYLLEKAALLQQMAYVTLTAIHPANRQKPVLSRHIAVWDVSQLKQAYGQLLCANQQGWGAYVGIGYRRRKLRRHQRGGKRDILALPAIFADVDQPPDRVLARLKTVPKPSLVIASGSGGHLYWILKKPTTDLVTAERVLKGMARWLDADTTMTSDQIMRLPLTQNTKPQARHALCSVLMATQQEYDLDDFLPYRILTTPQQTKPQKIKQNYRPRRRKPQSQAIVSRLTLNPVLAQVVLAELERNYGAVPKGNGWYACYCPFGHKHDRYPGDHAYYHPDKGLLNCFGRHGQHLIHSLAHQINLDVNLYGGIYSSDCSHAEG